MRKIKEIIVHCSDTPRNMDIGASEIRAWHKQKGWSDIGYHFVVRLDGTIEPGRPLNKVGAHCYGHNMNSIGVCYVGGRLEDGTCGDSRTAAQKLSLFLCLSKLKRSFPGAQILPHSKFANKKCPCFDVEKEYKCL